MLIQTSQLSLPPTALLSVRTEHSKSVERALQAFVRKELEMLRVAGGARLFSRSHSVDAVLAEVLAAAGDLERLTENEQADGAVALKNFRRLLNKLALESRHSVVDQHSNDMLVVRAKTRLL